MAPPFALPTPYRGIIFRSRLEARWAVWFDAVGVRWEYEPVGYDLGGIKYLADFYLPDEGAFCEIKPFGPLPERAIVKGTRLAQHTGRPVYVFHEPWWPIARAVWQADTTGVRDEAYDPPASTQEQLGYEYAGAYVPGWSTWLMPPGYVTPVLGALITREDALAARHPRLRSAYLQARAVRFDRAHPAPPRQSPVWQPSHG